MGDKTYYLYSCTYTHIEKAMPAQWSKCENIHFLQFRVNSTNLWTIIRTQVINNLHNATIQVRKYLPAKEI